MPVKPEATAPLSSLDFYDQVMPGDIFWTRGAGLVGAAIRHGTASPYGHCGVIVGKHSRPSQTWLVDEAFPAFPPWRPAIRRQPRKVSSVAAVVRVWRDETERHAIMSISREMGIEKHPYAWSEIAVIAAATVLPHSWIPSTDVSSAVICSNHVATCIQVARSDDYERYIRYPPHQMWPGGLAYDLAHSDLVEWRLKGVAGGGFEPP